MQALSLIYRYFSLFALTGILFLSAAGDAYAVVELSGLGENAGPPEPTWTDDLGAAPPGRARDPVEVRSLHFVEAKDSINQVKTACGISADVWIHTDPQVVSRIAYSQEVIFGEHINSLRSAVRELYAQKPGAVLPAALVSITRDTLAGDKILRSDIQDIRDALDNLSTFCAGAIVPQVCGDGAPQGTEQCDDGNTFNDDGCSSACQWNGLVCGDGILDIHPTSSEQCDDFNTNDGDGCSSICQTEAVARWYNFDAVGDSQFPRRGPFTCSENCARWGLSLTTDADGRHCASGEQMARPQSGNGVAIINYAYGTRTVGTIRPQVDFVRNVAIMRGVFRYAHWCYQNAQTRDYDDTDLAVACYCSGAVGAICGDGYVEGTEECDDALLNGAACRFSTCSTTCTVRTCR